MKLQKDHIEWLAQKVLASWKADTQVHLKVPEKQIYDMILSVIQKELDHERELERDVQQMLDKIEREHGTGLDRHKMSQMIRKKLAQEKKVIL